MSDDSGILSIDFLVGFTIFIIAFIWVVSMIPGLLINLQGYTIDYDAVAYRTGVILAEDPGEPALQTSVDPWEILSSNGVVRFGLAVSKDTPNILSQRKVNRFFCLSAFSYPVDYQNRTIFGDYPYQFNISLIEVGSDQPPRSVGDVMTGNYGSIRRLVKIKEPSIAMINASYDNTTHPDYFSGENETVHEFSILINTTELLQDKVRDPIYQINPAREQIIINITHLNETMPMDRNSCFNISLTNFIIRNKQLVLLYPLPDYKSVIDGVQYNQSSTPPNVVNNNISLLFDPPTFWSGIDQIYINLTFNLVKNASAPPACSAYNGSRFLNNTFTSPFDYNYNSTNVMQPQLRDAVLEVKIGSGARTVTEIVIEGLVAAFKWDWDVSGSPITVIFYDQSTGSPVSWDWDFDDGSHGTTSIPTHTYNASGIYNVTLTVTNATGGSATSTPQIVKIWNITATAGANGNITPTGKVLVADGTNQVFNITPNAGYYLANVTVDGGAPFMPAGNSYPFNNVVTDHTIIASFTVNPPIFSEYFGGGHNWTEMGGVDWDWNNPCGGTFGTCIRLRGTSSIQQTISTAGYSGITVSFYMGSNTHQWTDYVNASWSSDGGTTWNLLKQINHDDPEDDDDLYPFSYPPPPLAGADNNANFALRFSLQGTNNGDQGYVDNVLVGGNPI